MQKQENLKIVCKHNYMASTRTNSTEIAYNVNAW